MLILASFAGNIYMTSIYCQRYLRASMVTVAVLLQDGHAGQAGCEEDLQRLEDLRRYGHVFWRCQQRLCRLVRIQPLIPFPPGPAFSRSPQMADG